MGQRGAFESPGQFFGEHQADDGKRRDGDREPVGLVKVGEQVEPQLDQVLAMGINAEQMTELAGGNHDGAAADKAENDRVAKQVGQPAHAQGRHDDQDQAGEQGHADGSV